MSSTLLDTLSGLVTPDLIGSAASALGESEPAVSKGMSAVFPVLLSSVANRAEDADFASTLFNLVRDPANDGSLLGNVAGLLGPGASSSPMRALGGKWLLSRCMGPKETVTEVVETVPAPVVEPAPAPEPIPAPAVEAAPAAELPLANDYFEVDRFALPVAREGSLEAVIAYLEGNPTAVASVSGYHDPTGDAAHNEELARKRAQAVKDAMTAAGVPDSQIDRVKPIVTTGSGDMAEARRVEVAIRR